MRNSEMGDKFRLFNRGKVEDRKVNELIGLINGILADGKIVQSEIEFIKKWFATNQPEGTNPLISNLLQKINKILAGENVNKKDQKELFDTLQKFTASDFEMGELQKASSFPLTDPPPKIIFSRSRFCFTGVFAFGSRLDCEKIVLKKKGKVGGLTEVTDYLVVGSYANELWAHSSFGRKIENAVKMQKKGIEIAIVSESHWVKALNLKKK